MATYTGDWSGKGNAAIRVVLDIWETDRDETGVIIHWNRYLQATGWVDGRFSTSWAGDVNVYQTSGTNNYGASGGQKRISYGSSEPFSTSVAEIWTYSGEHWYSSINSFSYNPSIPVWTPNALTSGSVTRVSDSTATISATANPTTTRPYETIEIERSIDGGSWSRIASVKSMPYRDGTNAADHVYTYRVRAKNSAGYSSYLTCGSVTNSPKAPASVTVARSGSTSVAGAVNNGSVVATSIEIQRSVDKSAIAATLTSNNVKAFTDNPGGGSFYYRARNKNAVGTSAWTAWSNQVITICKPNAPTLVSPANSVTFSTMEANVVLKWQHNPLDGSAQTAWKMQVSTNGGSSWTSYTGTTEATKSLAMSSFSAGTTVMWKVSTKGAHADYSDWSSVGTFHVATPPTVSIEAPTGTIDSLPISLSISYSDSGGYELQDAVMTFLNANGTVAYTKRLGAVTHATISNSAWVPEDGKTYSITLQATSTSTLSSTVSGTMNISYTLPYPASLYLSSDAESGYVSILASIDTDAEGTFVAASTMTIWRVVDGVETLVADGVRSGESFVDMYAPLNKDYVYKVASFAASGAANTKEFKYRLRSSGALMMFGDGKTAKVSRNIKESFEITRPDKVRVWYAGATEPRSYDTNSISEALSVSGQLFGYGSDAPWREFVDSGGRGVYKSLLGRVMRVDANVNIALGNYQRVDLFDITIDMVRIEGEL